MSILIYVLISSFIVSLIALIGLILAPIKLEKLRKVLIYFVGFSAGALLGGAFFHLLPELIDERGFTFTISALLVGGIVLFFVIEKIIHWHHNLVPFEKEHTHPLAIMSLVGGSIHNLLDGLVIGTSFLINIPAGIAITTAVALHKIPKEMGWFGILVHGGFTKAKAIAYSYASSLFTIIGALFAVILSNYLENIQYFIIPIAVGGFIYLAGSDLIPELHKEPGLMRSILQLITILLGILIMAVLLFIN